MSLIPDEELRRERSLNLAPMVDFLFLVIALLATFAITRATLHDTNLELVKVRAPSHEAPLPARSEHFMVHLSVTSQGAYKWITEVDEYLMNDPSSVQTELLRQVQHGLLPKEKDKTKVLLHIDKSAPWESIAKVIFSVRESGFTIHPVYEPLETSLSKSL